MLAKQGERDPVRLNPSGSCGAMIGPHKGVTWRPSGSGDYADERQSSQLKKPRNSVAAYVASRHASYSAGRGLADTSIIMDRDPPESARRRVQAAVSRTRDKASRGGLQGAGWAASWSPLGIERGRHGSAFDPHLEPELMAEVQEWRAVPPPASPFCTESPMTKYPSPPFPNQKQPDAGPDRPDGSGA